jgi:hypothetical protein
MPKFDNFESFSHFSYSHRWARVLKQQSSMTVYRLPNNENKLLFSIPVCSKQTEVVIFHWFRFPFAKNRKHGDIETWRHKDLETWIYEDMETWGHGFAHCENRNL